MVSQQIIKELDIKSDLFLFGNLGLNKTSYLNKDLWENIYFMTYDLNVFSYIKNSRNKLLKNEFKNKYDYIIYFVDTDIPNQLFLKNNSKATRILIEEGIGLYDMGVLDRFRSIIKKIFFSIFCFKNVSFKHYEQGANKYHDYLLCRIPEILPENKKNTNVLKYDVIESSLEQKVTESENRKILYLGSNMCKMGWMKEDDERKLFEAVFFNLINDGYKIYIKPHPREEIEKYQRYSNIEIIQSDEPAEIIGKKLDPVATFSIASSGILNLPNGVFLYNFVKTSFPNKKILKKIERLNKLSAPTTYEELLKFQKNEDSNIKISTVLKSLMV